MRRRLIPILCLALVALTLGGCTKCGFIWETGPRSCHGDSPRL
jgi:hypothetical protein